MSTYIIHLRNRVNLTELNPLSPQHMIALETDQPGTHFVIHTDQAGLVGMLQSLHNYGLIIQLVQCQSLYPAEQDAQE